MSLLPWFVQPVERLTRMLHDDKLPHALLLCVPDGWDVGNLLQAFAVGLLNLPAADADPETLAHPDFMWVRTWDKDGGVSKVIQVDAIRALGEFISLRPSVAPRKLAIIPHAHRLNTNAANALLKTLEEPAGASCLLLETREPAQLMPTLRSRCQRLPMTFSRAMAETWLVSAGKPETRDLLDIVGGGPIDALALGSDPGARMTEALARLVNAESRPVELDRLARSDGLHGLLGQWYRLTVKRLAGSGSPSERARLLAFADELLFCQRQIDGVKGSNTRLLLDRLVFLWVGADTA